MIISGDAWTTNPMISGWSVLQWATVLPLSNIEWQPKYCRFGNFRKNFIFANSIKRHISNKKNSWLSQNLPISINDRVILPFPEGEVSRKIKSSRKFPNLQYYTDAYSDLSGEVWMW